MTKFEVYGNSLVHCCVGPSTYTVVIVKDGVKYKELTHTRDKGSLYEMVILGYLEAFKEIEKFTEEKEIVVVSGWPPVVINFNTNYSGAINRKWRTVKGEPMKNMDLHQEVRGFLLRNKVICKSIKVYKPEGDTDWVAYCKNLVKENHSKITKN